MRAIKIVIFFFLLNLNQFQVFSIGNNSGIDCQNAYSVNTNDQINYAFNTSQSSLYFDYTASSDSLYFIFTDDGQGQFAEINKVEVYQKTNCSILTLIITDSVGDPSEANYFELYGLSVTQNYLIKVSRDVNSSLPNATFQLNIPERLTLGCNAPLACNEMIKNGDFEHVKVPEDNFNELLAFGNGIFHPGPNSNKSEVCNWNSLTETPHIRDKTASDLTVCMFSNYTQAALSYESIRTAVDIKANTNYVLSFELKEAIDPNNNTQIPEFFKVRVINASNLSSIIYNPIDFTNSTTPSVEIASVPRASITSNWKTFSFCVNVGQDYDRIYFFPFDSSPQSLASLIDFDNVSMRKIDDIDAGPDIDLSAVCGSDDWQIGNVDCQMEGVTYQWIPPLGIDNPDKANSTLNNFAAGTYTLSVSAQNGTCSTTAQVNVTGATHVYLQDGKDLIWARNQTPFVTFNAGTNGYESVDAEFLIEGEFIVDQDWTLTNCKIWMEKDAKITVKDGADFIFNGNANSFIKSCGDFWDGIYGTGVAGLSNATKIEINDAHPFQYSSNGIVTNPSAELIVDNVEFEQNKQCIYIASDYNLVNNQLVDVQNSSFSCNPPLQYSNGDYYYPTKAVVMEYDIDNHADRPLFKNNHFDGSAGMISLIQSDADFVNNTFENFNHTPGLPNYPGDPAKPNVAVFYQGKSAIFESSGPTGKIILDENYFILCRVAIETKDHLRFEVVKNKMNKTDQGLKINGVANNIFYRSFNNNNPDSPLYFTPWMSIDFNKINENEIWRSVSSIELLNFTEAVEIKLNEFEGNFIDVFKGVLIDNANINLNWAPNVKINNNDFITMNKGIDLIGGPTIGSYEMKNNTFDQITPITLSGCSPQPCSEIPAFGIRLLLIADPHIQDNEFINTHSTNNQNIEGVISMASGIDLSCNKFEYLGNGIRFIGNYYQFAQNLMNNRFKNNYWGIVLDNNAEIGAIGSPLTASGNIWEITNPPQQNFEGIRCINSTDGRLSNLHWDPSISIPPTNSADASSFPLTTTNATGSYMFCSTPLRVKNGYFNNLQSNSSNNLNWSDKVKRRIMKNTSTDRSYFEAQLSYLIYLQDTLLQKDSINDFIADSLSKLPFGKLINQFNSNARDSLKFNLVKSNYRLDREYLFCLEMQVKLLNGSHINETDIVKLRRIASQCPDVLGYAVYSARNVLGQLGETGFWNSCEFVRKANKQSFKRVKSDLNEEEFKVYPNPLSTRMNINFMVDVDQQVLIDIHDVLGKKIYSHILKEGYYHTFEIPKFESGLYFFRLTNNSRILKEGKIVIQQN